MGRGKKTRKRERDRKSEEGETRYVYKSCHFLFHFIHGQIMSNKNAKRFLLRFNFNFNYQQGQTQGGGYLGGCSPPKRFGGGGA